MSKKMYGILGVMAIMIVGFIAFQIYLHIDMKNFRNELDASTKVKTEIPETPNVVFSDEKPDDIPGFEWVRHDDHWEKVSINEPIQPIEQPPVEEKPKIMEVSNSPEKFVDLTTDEGLRYFYLGGRYSPQHIKYIKDLHTIEIKQLQKLVLSYEASNKKTSEILQRRPDSDYFRKSYEEDKLRLDDYKRRLKELKRVMQVVYDVK